MQRPTAPEAGMPAGDGARRPFISCIVTAFNEGRLVEASIQSLLNQSFADFEVLIVDDGASPETLSALQSFDDPRITLIRQANDGLSSARNRALSCASGAYVCFLDADDIRPPWAFAEMARLAKTLEVDCVFSPGLLCDVRGDVRPFYDEPIFAELVQRGLSRLGPEEGRRLKEAVGLLACTEPQSANKFVRRAFLEHHKLRFPSGHFFEDMLFHNGILMNMESYAVTDLPTFTYFRRYGRPQITGSSSKLRFDAISTAGSLLAVFETSRYASDPVIRRLVLAATFKLLKWCETSVSLDYRQGYRQSLHALISRLDPRFRLLPSAEIRMETEKIAPWVRDALNFFDELVVQASAQELPVAPNT